MDGSEQEIPPVPTRKKRQRKRRKSTQRKEKREEMRREGEGSMFKNEQKPNGNKGSTQPSSWDVTGAVKKQESQENMNQKLDQGLNGQQSTCKGNYQDLHSDDVILIENQRRFLEDLDLLDYFPEKISLEMVMERSLDCLDSLSDIPWRVLSQLLMLDYRGRDNVVPLKTKKSAKKEKNAVSVSEDDWEDTFSKLFDSLESESFCVPHPSDVIVSSLRCCSNTLKQVICEKMFTCKLSIPLLLPPVLGKKAMLLLWSLRGINLECLSSEGECHLVSAVNHFLPVVSFARLGEISRSKSKFLNEIVNNQTHSTFFTRDCENGRCKRKVSEGVIEMAWRLKSINDYDNNMLFLNLRGNGSLHKLSLNFLLKVSDVVVIMIDASDTLSDIITLFREVKVCDGQYIFFITKQPHITFTKDQMEKMKLFLEALRQIGLKIIGMIFDFDGRGEKNIKSLKSEVEEKLGRCLKNSMKGPIENFETVAEAFDFAVDSNVSSCRSGKERALEIMNIIKKNGESSKSTNLPLQCQPWKQWAALNKEEHRGEKRGNDYFDQYASKIYFEKMEKRNEQICLLEKSKTPFDYFLRHLVNSSLEQRLYFLKWLKICLDDNSRELLPVLRKNCNIKWDEIHQYNGKQTQSGAKEKGKYSNLKHELRQSEKKLEESSLGLEHFMRESAQAYEAISSVSNPSEKLEKKISSLPKIVAELMIHGYPLELMDGDAAHIPLKWVNAVLCQLHTIIGDKRIFVLSVLGVQSSGKSTLLNTLFGLKFSVAAGRCTRGVYAQLVPIPEKYHRSKYDYILVLDTEGLRAPELGDKKIQHDNEIATLVIGLGNAVLINIKGENSSEIEDVLQIVIHALLKMKLVNKSIKLQPSCFFIHQNVSALDAAQQLKSGQRKFIETLDKVTKSAGKQEDAPQFTKFSQLIDFDINKNVFYFSDLWKGDPPMAPANPGYSENIIDVKERLLGYMMEKRTGNLDITKLSVKIHDIWNGILDQNFVFSFKNSLEMDTFSSLESKLSDLQWNLKTVGVKWLVAKTNMIENSEMIDKHAEIILINELQINLNKKFQEEKRNLERYFEIDEDNAMLHQWKSVTFQKLKNCYEDTLCKASKSVKSKLEIKKIQNDSKRDIEKYKNIIMKEARNLAEELRKKESNKLDEERIRHYFQGKWNQWMDNIEITSVEDDISIGNHVKKVLTDQFLKDNALLKKCLINYHTVSEEVIKKELDNTVDMFVKDTLARDLQHFTHNYHNKTAKGLLKKAFDGIYEIVMQSKGLLFTDMDIKSIIEIGMTKISSLKSLEIRLSDEKKFSIYVIVIFYEYARHIQYKMYEISRYDEEIEQTKELSSDYMFQENVRNQFSESILPIIEELKTMMHKNFSLTNITKDDLCESEGIRKEELLHAQKIVESFYDKVDNFIRRTEIQNFKEEYVEQIIKKAKDMATNGKVRFTKRYIIQLAISACYKALPVIYDKHKRYIDSMNPRKVLERDYFATYFEMFKSTYHKIAAEEALSTIMSERLSTAIENAVDRDMTTDLADDVRNNVPQVKLKKALLHAILCKLLEVDQFHEFFLYLRDIDSCYKKWISYFIDNYLFSKRIDGSTRYLEIASLKISSLISKIREDIIKTKVPVLTSNEEASQDALVLWVQTFHEKITEKLPVSLCDMLSLIDGYEVLTLDSFTRLLEQNLKRSEEKLRIVFKEHSQKHLMYAHCPTVYELIAQECKGCTERCPFCSAPCTLNNETHLENDIKHMTHEHYSQACGGWRYEGNKKLVTSNCTVNVASGKVFKWPYQGKNYHPYSKYYEIFPDWKIHGDPSLEASPYWKWFLVKYESQLAERYNCERPDIPDSWRSITKEMVMESLDN